MESPIAVANFFINKSLETGMELTPMKLVKLVYISHGWYLGLTESPLISEAVEAWKYGPVIPDLYYEFKQYGSDQIKNVQFDIPTMKFPIVTDKDTVQFLNKIWDVYGSMTGTQLSTLTHLEGTPWYITWHERGGKNSQSVQIPNDLIQKHYKQKALSDINDSRH
jgi:uncharacterized phage-associated protein